MIPRDRTTVVAVVAERTVARLRVEAARASARADLLEVRLDALDPGESHGEAVRGLPLPVLATWRRRADGGRRLLREETRLRRLAEAGRAGAAWLDVEADAPAPAPADRGGALLLRSLHLRPGASPVAALERVEAAEGDAGKVVFAARDAAAALRGLEPLLRRATGARPLALFAAGPEGAATRLLAPHLGGGLVYAASRPGRAPVPGMPSAAELDSVYRLAAAGAGGAVFALLGGNLAHSLSPWTMNAALRSAGVPGIYVPVPCVDGPATVRALAALGVRGVALTAPHKEVPLRMAEEVEPGAARAGAANTLLRRGGRWVAANTDGPAARGLAEAALGDLAGRTAVVLGAGGAARAMAVALHDAGMSVRLVARDGARAAAAAARVGVEAGAIGGAVDLLVNGTPAGQWPGPPEDPAAALVPGLAAGWRFDAVYRPGETPFLAAVPRERRITGLDLLLAQGALQWRAWEVGGVDPAAMRAAGEAALRRADLRIVLVGMRGVGKSAVAEAIARTTGRPLLDTDRMVEERTGRRVYDIFREDGEGAFRALERVEVARALSPPGTVVALGGGAVLHLDGPPPGSVVVRLRARPETLGRRLRDSGRPSLLGRPPEEEVLDLLRVREPAYARLASVVVDTDDLLPEEVAADVLEATATV